jgi:hypothetical protein
VSKTFSPKIRFISIVPLLAVPHSRSRLVAAVMLSRAYLDEITDRLITEEIYADDSEPEIRHELPGRTD